MFLKEETYQTKQKIKKIKKKEEENLKRKEKWGKKKNFFIYLIFFLFFFSFFIFSTFLPHPQKQKRREDFPFVFGLKVCSHQTSFAQLFQVHAFLMSFSYITVCGLCLFLNSSLLFYHLLIKLALCPGSLSSSSFASSFLLSFSYFY